MLPRRLYQKPTRLLRRHQPREPGRSAPHAVHPIFCEDVHRDTENSAMLSLRRMLARRSVSRPASRSALKVRPALESLESRLVLYSTSGNLWPNPQLVTISFMPDGTNLGGISSNLFATFNSNPKLVSQWQSVILKAAQVWAQQTNINFAVVPDNGAPFGSGNYEQGDPGFGDIRIGGYAFGGSSLAMAYQPPPVNDFSLAGDVMFNTSQRFNIGSTYDLFSVAAHEFGHALGMDHSNVTSAAVMYPTYNGIKTVLNADDIAGVESIYSGGHLRSPDAYNSGGSSDGSFTTATNLNSLINQTQLTALVPNLDLNTVSQSEYFNVQRTQHDHVDVDFEGPEQRTQLAFAEGDGLCCRPDDRTRNG